MLFSAPFFVDICEAGKEFNENGVCMPCGRGQYKDNSNVTSRFSQCVPCPANFTTNEEGATAFDFCYIRM